MELGQLQKALQKLQLMVHPDKHSTKGNEGRQLAEQQSSRLNKAFSVLQSPLERAKYLVCSYAHECRLPRDGDGSLGK